MKTRHTLRSVRQSVLCRLLILVLFAVVGVAFAQNQVALASTNSDTASNICSKVGHQQFPSAGSRSEFWEAVCVTVIALIGGLGLLWRWSRKEDTEQKLTSQVTATFFCGRDFCTISRDRVGGCRMLNVCRKQATLTRLAAVAPVHERVKHAEITAQKQRLSYTKPLNVV